MALRPQIVLGMCWLAIAGCPKKPEAIDLSWQETPRLPSPSAGTYARAPGAPPDPPLATLVAGKRWDASLGGAAAGVALLLNDSTAVPNWQVRHEAWRAGYPYPVSTLSIWHSPTGQPPPEGVTTWLAAVKSEQDIGLVRARSVNGDTWVGLAAAPRGNIGVQPRQLPVGASFTLPPIAGASFLIADSRGGLRTGTLEIAQTFTADLPGEWIIKVTDAEGVLARYPLYVGTTPPTQPVVGSETEGDPTERTQQLVDDIRASHNRASYNTDLLFESAARRQLTGPLTKDELAARLGWSPDRLTTWDVVASSIPEALDRVLWEPSSRPALLADNATVGIAAADTDRGVHVVVLVGFE